MNNKKLIRLTEADLHRIVKESVENVLNEGMWDNFKAGVKGAMTGAKHGYYHGMDLHTDQEKLNAQGNYQPGRQSQQNSNSYGSAIKIAKYIQEMGVQVDDYFIESLNGLLNNLKTRGRWQNY